MMSSKAIVVTIVMVFVSSRDTISNDTNDEQNHYSCSSLLSCLCLLFSLQILYQAFLKL